MTKERESTPICKAPEGEHFWDAAAMKTGSTELEAETLVTVSIFFKSHKITYKINNENLNLWKNISLHFEEFKRFLNYNHL